MYEQLLEDVAQNNALREVHPGCKLAAGLGAIILCLAAGSCVAPVVIALILITTLLFLARIDARICTELFAAPLLFAGTGVAVIILISGGEGVLWQGSPLPGLVLSVTRESIDAGALVFFRVLGGMSALFFIALTTPMTDLFIVMRRCGFPVLLLDLSMIIYRTIFILLDQLVQIYHAQVMRRGYSAPRESIRSFAMLCGAVFIGSWEAGEDLIRAMDARCYDGKFAILGDIGPLRPAPVLAVGLFLALSAGIVLYTRDISLLHGVVA